MSKRSLYLFFILIISIPVSGKSKNPQDTFLEAEYFMLKEDYSEALPYYKQLYEKMPDNANLAYCIGLCYLNIPGKKDLSIEYLEKASKNISEKHKEGTIKQVSAPLNSLFDLGKAYQVNYKFNEAKLTFQRYLDVLPIDDSENINFIKHEIEKCDMAKDIISKPVSFTEENIGATFNDEKDNFNPLISADGKTFAFMTSLKFYDAVMFSRLVDGKWFSPVNITPDLQVDDDYYISCLSADGKTLLLSKDDNFNSDIWEATYNGTVWTPATLLNKNINTKSWESHGFLSDDDKLLVFSSDRPGGYGGLDLYISTLTNGEWGPDVNLGPEINTPYNEDRPFLINNGKTLFFSSQGHVNLGGYDIFRSDLKNDNKWGQPSNLGYPINTPEDDIYFMPTDKGKEGYLVKSNGTGSFGKEDIYKIVLK
jgi:hypothetical protein